MARSPLVSFAHLLASLRETLVWPTRRHRRQPPKYAIVLSVVMAIEIVVLEFHMSRALQSSAQDAVWRCRCRPLQCRIRGR